MNEPNWILANILSVVLGLALPELIRLIRFLWRRRKSDRLERDWFEYHVTFVGGQAFIVGGTWSVRRGLKGLRVDYKHRDDATLSYKGLIARERGHLLATLHASSDAETLYYRFIDPVGSRTVVPGLWLSYDREGRICSGSALLSLEAIDDTVVGRMLSAAVDLDASLPALRITGDSAIPVKEKVPA
jgi:hypothetical protein